MGHKLQDSFLQRERERSISLLYASHSFSRSLYPLHRSSLLLLFFFLVVVKNEAGLEKRRKRRQNSQRDDVFLTPDSKREEGDRKRIWYIFSSDLCDEFESGFCRERKRIVLQSSPHGQGVYDSIVIQHLAPVIVYPGPSEVKEDDSCYVFRRQTKVC